MMVRAFGPALETGFSLGHGLSVCAPTTTKPEPAAARPPTANATSVEALRVK